VGVHRDKFYPTGVKGNLDALDKALAKLDISDNISRENVFSEYRDTVQLIFNKSFYSSPCYFSLTLATVSTILIICWNEHIEKWGRA
jgi:hypothetical protein